jgi:hypothetical protein
LVKNYSSQESIKILMDKVAGLELMLKSDLGIYGIEHSETDAYGVRLIDSFARLVHGKPTLVNPPSLQGNDLRVTD